MSETFQPFQPSQPSQPMSAPTNPAGGEALMTPSASDATPSKRKKSKRGGRRTPLAASEQPAEPREPKRAPKRPPRRANPAKRPRRSTVRKPKRASAMPDLEKTAAVFIGLHEGDGALLQATAALLQAGTPAQCKRVVAVLSRLFD